MKAQAVVIAMGLAAWASLSLAEEKPAKTSEGWGSVDGQFLLDGPYTTPLRFKEGDRLGRDAEVCACRTMLDETLVVDPTTKGITNIFVFLRKAPDKIHPDLIEIPPPRELTAKDCQFVPHCGTLRVGQVLNVKYLDRVEHNAHFFPTASAMPGFIVIPNDPQGTDHRFTRPESLPMRVVCDVHSWMDCYWTVLDHPYATLTDKEGRFSLEKLPAGDLTFCVWHERCGYVIREYKVHISADCRTTLPIEKVPLAKMIRKSSSEPKE